jgi:actin-related protein 2
MVFLGGAVLANIVSDSNDLRHAHAYFTQMADKEDMWISKQEWEEQGSRALEKLGAR